MNDISHPSPISEDTRQRIIEAALRLFGRIGYKASTTRAIADAAGVNEVTLFRHFGNKKNILMACMKKFNASGFAATYETVLQGNYRDDIRAMARLQIQDTSASMDILRMMVCDARNVPELLDAMTTGSAGNMSRVEAYFQTRLDQGVVRPEFNARELAALFDHLFSMKLFYDNMFRDQDTFQFPSEAELDRMVGFFVRGTEVER
jgi:AcrR family transcriptional regulator